MASTAVDYSRSFLLTCNFSFLPPQGSGQQPRFDRPPEETVDLDELKEFSKMFKQKRIKLGTVVYYMFADSPDIYTMIHHFV